MTPIAQGGQQFGAGAKNPLGMVKRDPPGFGQDQLSPAPFEQRMTQTILQMADLRRQRGLRQVQPLGRARQMTFARNLAEIAQMMVIQPIHDALN